MQLVFFDFDETLIYENCLAALFKKHLNVKHLLFQVLPLLTRPMLYKLGLRQAIKRYLYKKSLKELNHSILYESGFDLAFDVTPNRIVLQKLRLHKQQGCKICIATASPTEYVQGILDARKWPYDYLIGTSLTTIDGFLTGEFDVECSYCRKKNDIQNFVTKNKLKHAEYLAAYGNLPADYEMLKMVKQGIVVKGSILSYFQP